MDMLPVTAMPIGYPASADPILERWRASFPGRAQQTVAYPILVPAYPSDIMAWQGPKALFVQDAEGDMTVMVWIDPQYPTQVLMSHHFPPRTAGLSIDGSSARPTETTVNGQRSCGLLVHTACQGVSSPDGDLDFVRLIESHVLIWKDGGSPIAPWRPMLTLEEAIKEGKHGGRIADADPVCSGDPPAIPVGSSVISTLNTRHF